MATIAWFLVALALQPLAYHLGVQTGKAHRRWINARRRRALIARLEASMRDDAEKLHRLLQAARDR